MIYIALVLFFISKIFYQYDLVGGIIFAILALVNIRKKEQFLVYYMLLISTNTGYLIILFNTSIIFFSLANMKFNKYKIHFILFVSTLFLLTLLFHFNSVHDALRLVIVFTSAAIFFYNIKKLDKIFLDKFTFYIYLCLVMAQMINIYLLDISVRGSVFSGGENIAIIIFSFFVLRLYYSQYITMYQKTLSTFLYIIFLLHTESRSSIIVVAILGITFLYNKFKIINIYTFPLFGILLSIIIVGIDYMPTEGSGRIINTVNTLISIKDRGELTNISAYAEIDIRGRINAEAIERISEHPFVGSGVVNPTVLEELADKHGGMSSFHNGLFDILVTYGFIGFIGFLLWFFYLAKFLISKRPNLKQYYIAHFSLFFLIGLVQPYLFNVQISSFFYLFLFLVYKEQYER